MSDWTQISVDDAAYVLNVPEFRVEEFVEQGELTRLPNGSLITATVTGLAERQQFPKKNFLVWRCCWHDNTFTLVADTTDMESASLIAKSLCHHTNNGFITYAVTESNDNKVLDMYEQPSLESNKTKRVIDLDYYEVIYPLLRLDHILNKDKYYV